MFETIKQTAMHIPWWVYVLLVVLLRIGIHAFKTRVVSIKRLFVAPAIFSFMAIETLMNNVGLSIFAISIFASGLLIGIVLGWIQVARQPLRFDRTKQLIRIPGTWTVMAVVIIIFSTKYYFGYELAMDPSAIKNITFDVLFIGGTAICTGLFIGKLVCYFKRMFTEPQSSL